MTLLMWRAYRQALRERADCYHIHDPELVPLAVLLKLTGHCVVYDVHEDVPLQILAKSWIPSILRRPIASVVGGLEQAAARVLDGIVSATPSIARRFPRDKTVVVQNFPTLSEFSRTESPARERATFVYVGVVSPIRGVREISAAARILGEKCPGARLHVHGPIRPPVLADELRHIGGESVTVNGWASREVVSDALSRASAGLVVLHPVRNYLDSYPVKMFEYMAAGLPVIASDFPLWREIVDGAQCGLLVDPMNPDAIADAMRWIVENPDESAAMGRRGQQAVADLYNWENEAAKLIGFYDRIIA
jgi:glycosyltransferase involved in cell wall biosynthesis